MEGGGIEGQQLRKYVGKTVAGKKKKKKKYTAVRKTRVSHTQLGGARFGPYLDNLLFCVELGPITDQHPLSLPVFFQNGKMK